MAQIPSTKRFTMEDFKDQQGWIGRLLTPLNEFMQSVTFALSNQLTIKDNLAQEIKDVEVSVTATNMYPIYFKCKFSTRAVAMWVGNAVEIAGSPAVITNPVYIDWEYVNGQVKINNISGLTVGKRYRLTLVVSYG